MGTFKKSKLAYALAVGLGMFWTAPASSSRLGSYDFSYESVGSAKVRPVQVFDDGRSTWFQFRSGEDIPAIFAETPGGLTLLMPTQEGPYVKVPAVPRGFTLRIGYSVGKVTYTNRGAQASIAAPAHAAPPVAASSPPASAPSAAHAALPVMGTTATAPKPNTGIGAYLPKSEAPAPAAAPSAPAAAAPPVAPQPATLPSSPAQVPGGTANTARLLAATQMIQGLPRDMFNEPPLRPTLERDSYATPVRGDLVEWTASHDRVQDHQILFGRDSTKLSPQGAQSLRAIVRSARASSRFEVVGHDDEAHREKTADQRAAAVVAALVAAGASRGAISVRTTSEVREGGKGMWIGATVRVHDGAPPAVRTANHEKDVASVAQRLAAGAISPAEALALLQRARQEAVAARMPTSWSVLKADQNIERMFARWAKEAGWKLVWQSAPAVPITGDTSISRQDLVQAVDYVITQARSAGYAIQATAYLGNQTIVIKGE